MTSTFLATLAGIAVLDSINPTANAMHLYLLTLPRPVRRSIAFTAGILLANFIGGVLAVLGAQVLQCAWDHGTG